MIKRLLGMLLAVIFMSALCAIVLPPLLLVTTSSFPQRVLFSILFMLISCEKTWAMFFRMRKTSSVRVEQDWTSVTVGLSYVLVTYLVLICFYAKQEGIRQPVVSVAGLAIYAVAVWLRYWAFSHLGRQWAVQVDKSTSERLLIATGPYRWMRHPLYTGAILETVGLPLAFNTYVPLAVALAVFVPLEVHRAYFEENYLRTLFGADYRAYKSRVWAFFPLPFTSKWSIKGRIGGATAVSRTEDSP
ncbi:MAG: isoprenylcysteine carboxylmethyltransferase family protein [Candidatus Pacebacteria bacterium]|nr:isoprenylcysteine carboxylmethyltransferase family protein [Candidatus Paceibacterota bacterium]